VSRTPLDACTDPELVARYRRDQSPVAVQELVRRHERSVYAFAHRFLGDREAAEDATQEVFVRAVRHLDGWDGRAQFRTWLFRIARNHCIDAQRKAKLRKTESLDAPSDPEGPPRSEGVASDGPDPEGSLAGRQLAGAVARAVDSLPPAQREVLLLRREGELSFKEIAEMIDVSENTVKSRMRYALEHLRTLLEREGFLS
jgi:RNA polymerase sigma-70 factor, ECF subfamily